MTNFTAYAYIDTPARLLDLLPDLESASRLAIDTEADSLHSYFEKVCLVQLSFGGRHVIIDPLAPDMDLSPVVDILRRTPLVLHGADYDLRMLRQSFAFRPEAGIDDTMIAAQLLGYNQLGLAALVEGFFGYEMSKSGQKSNWSARPLPDKLMNYAVDDTRFLERLMDILLDQLRRLGREDWFRQSCEAVVKATAEDNEKDPEKIWRVKGHQTLDRRELAMLREVWRWREKEAAAADRPPFKIMGNPDLVKLAKWGASTQSTFIPDNLLKRRCSHASLEALKEALERGRTLPKEQWPAQRLAKGRPPSPDEKEREDKLRDETAAIAEKLKLDPAVIASRARLSRIASECPGSLEDIMAVGNLQEWQAVLLEPAVHKHCSEVGSS